LNPFKNLTSAITTQSSNKTHIRMNWYINSSCPKVRKGLCRRGIYNSTKMRLCLDLLKRLTSLRCPRKTLLTNPVEHCQPRKHAGPIRGTSIHKETKTWCSKNPQDKYNQTHTVTMLTFLMNRLLINEVQIIRTQLRTVSPQYHTKKITLIK